MGKYRSRLRIIADILSIVQSKRANGARKTQIMYGANLSYEVLSRYLADVLGFGLLSLGSVDCYVLTRKGEEFLKRFDKYAELCGRLENLLDDVKRERAMLERMCLGWTMATTPPSKPIEEIETQKMES